MISEISSNEMKTLSIIPASYPAIAMAYMQGCAHANTSFKALHDTLHLYSDMPLLYMITWHVAISILTNCYRIVNLPLQKFTFTKNQTFYKNFSYTVKLWSHTVADQ